MIQHERAVNLISTQVFIFDTTLDAFYAILPIWLMLMGCREQSLILPHDPMTFLSLIHI